ncbi:DUF2341 domain-containing protein [Methanoregula formicica]|uniref:PDK repeat-containing protein n=1 Tax=Methanoregula formicica (strain DSM 22288 / NBRC 105244 / SMSP) TaxID=593750 RepID=L0HEY1_METFS|nr:DUF2341 domain-containing protein [Methanoregula formicica]AGB01873.1 PDK repeat-containing protein [Methanoregula formicica SMSP]
MQPNFFVVHNNDYRRPLEGGPYSREWQKNASVRKSFLVLACVLLACTAAVSAADWTPADFTGHTQAYIHGAATDLSDYQVKFVLYNVTGTDSSENIHLPGIAQPDFDDVRFALSDGTPLNYWMETPAGIDNATFWIKVPSIPAGYANTIPVDIYYGSATISSGADGAATFALFDDFNGSSLDTTKWTVVYNAGGISISNSQLILKNTVIQSKINFNHNASLRFRGNLWGYTQTIGFEDDADTVNRVYFKVTSGDGYEYFYTKINSETSFINPGYWSGDRYQTGELFWNATHVAVTDGVNPIAPKQDALTATLPIYLESQSSSTGYYDWIFVRQLADSEPPVNEPGATAPTVDLTVNSVSSLVPRTANTVTATIMNQGTADAGAFKANFTLNGSTTAFDIPSLASGGYTTISVTDPITSRVLGDTIPLSIELDTQNAIAETCETNNTYSTPATVVRGTSYYSGGRYYTGHDIETGNYTEGNVALLHSWGDSGYIKNGAWPSTTVQWTAADLPIPADATVKAARLYQSYTWSSNGDPRIAAQFNGNTVKQAAFYGDGLANIYSTYDDFNGQVIWDVTPYFSKTGNTAIITAEAPQGGLYATVLVVVYERDGEPFRRIWLDEGCDSLLYGGGTGYAMFNNVTTSSLGYARLSTILPSGADNAQSTVAFNSQSIPIAGAEGSNEAQDPGFKYYDVTSALQDGTNELAVTQDGYMNLAAAILELTYGMPPEVSFKTNVTSGYAPLTVQFTDLSYGATGWQWDFDNDGTVDSTEKNPVYTYDNADTYTVNLTAANGYGSNTKIQSSYITASSPGNSVVAGFTVALNGEDKMPHGQAPVTVSFTDASAGTIDTYLWEYRNYNSAVWTAFGDGAKNPASIVFSDAGTYDIRLTVTNATTGSSNKTIAHAFTAGVPDDPVATITNGTVSGGLFVDSRSPWPATTVTYSYTLPASGSTIVWARVFVNDYSGSGSGNFPFRLTTEFDADGDGTFETTLGAEDCDIQSETDKESGVYRPFVYPLNDHVTKVYSDYEAWYDVTGLITSANPKIRVTSSDIGAPVGSDDGFDGRIKAVTLVVAYNDGDTDQVKYIVNHGNDWRVKDTSSSSAFNAGSFAGGWSNATLTSVAFSSKDATYTLNGAGIANTTLGSNNYYKYNTFNVTDRLVPASSNTFGYTAGDPSFKICLATLAATYPGSGASAPVAAFSGVPASGTAPLTVTFTDSSTNSPTGWLWDFGDGDTTNATKQNPVHTYANAGTYFVNLTATNAAGSDFENKTGYITVTSAGGGSSPEAIFLTDVVVGPSPLTVAFTDQSATNPTKWAWDFNNDGITDSSDQNPIYIFSSAGRYTVNLTVTNASGSSTLIKPNLIAVSAGPDPLTTVTSGTVSGDLYVNSVSPWSTTNTTTFELPDAAVNNITWARLYVTTYTATPNSSYNTSSVVTLDGTVLGTEILNIESEKNGNAYPVNDHVMKVYADYEAWYDVTGRITSARPVVAVTNSKVDGYLFDGRIKGITLVLAYNDGDSEIVKYWVNHGNNWMGPAGAGSATTFDVTPLAAGWENATLTSVAFSGKDAAYTFPTSSSSPAKNILGTSSYWKYNSFNVTDSLIAGSANTLGFTAVGTSFKTTLATLAVKYPGGGVPPSAPVADFLTNINPASGPAPLMVQFTDTSTNTPASWKWEHRITANSTWTQFSTEQNPTYTFTTTGTYDIRLTATNAGGSDNETKTGYVTASSSGTAPVAAFSASATTGTAPLTVTFTDTSTNAPTGWLWDFGDGDTTNATVQNPVHTYINAGTYFVNLTAANTAGSDFENKTAYITVSSGGTPTSDLSLATSVVNTVVNETVFAREENPVTITNIRNIGSTPITNVVVALYASDVSSTVPVNTATIASIAGSGTTSVTISDPTIRDTQGGTVTYKVVVDPANLISETNEANNEMTGEVKPVKFNGYKGKGIYWKGGSNITTKKYYDLNGDIVSFTQPESTYKGVGWSSRTETWTGAELPLPSDATVEYALLFISYNWDQTPGGFPIMTATFNSHNLPLGTPYTDIANFGSYPDYEYGLYPAIDVTTHFVKGGENTLVMSPGTGNKQALYPSTLVVIYRNSSATRKQIFINEECDELLLGETAYGTSLNETIAYAPFTELTIDTGNVTNAALYSFAGSAGPKEGNLFFNGNKIGTKAWQGTLNTANASVFNVKPYLSATGNEAGIQGTNSGGMVALQQILVVEYKPAEPTAPTAAFDANTTTGTIPLTVKFRDRSSGIPTSWAWDFDNDGSIDDTNQSPTHTYTSPGTYTVSLTATNGIGSNKTVKTNHITATLAPPKASFTANKTAGDTPLAVQFTDTSTGGPETWAWDFGDGGTSKEKDPVHTFEGSGTYSVSLAVTNSAGSDSETKSGYISVNAKKVVDTAFNLTGVATVSTGTGQNVSVNTSQVTTAISGNTVALTSVGNGWSSLNLIMTDTPDVVNETVNGIVSTVVAVGEEITVPIPAVGSPTIHVELALDELPESTQGITQTITKDPDTNASSSFTIAASNDGKQLDIGYTVNFQKNGGLENAANGGTIRNATVYFAINSTWVADHGGRDKIVIMRKPDSGDTTFLDVTYLGTDGRGNDKFSALSPDGLSIFIIGAGSPVPTPTPSPTSSTPSGGSDSYSYTGSSSGSRSSGDVQKGKIYDYSLRAPLQSNGAYQTTAISSKGRVSITPMKAELSATMPEAKAKWSAEIVSDPDGGGRISTSLATEIPASAISSYNTALSPRSLEIASVAYAMNVEEDDRIGTTKDGVIEMTAPQAWVSENGGINQVKIFRIGNDGSAGLLSTAFSGYDHETGYLTFRAESPDGLCTFILLAVRPASGTGAAAASPPGTGQGVPAGAAPGEASQGPASQSAPGTGIATIVAGVLVVAGCAGLVHVYRGRRKTRP